MSYNPNDPAQNSHWDTALANQLEVMSRELLAQANEARGLGFGNVSSALQTAYQAILNAANALHEEASLLDAQASEAEA